MTLDKTFLAILLFGWLFSCNYNIAKVPSSSFPISDDAFTVETIAAIIVLIERNDLSKSNGKIIRIKNQKSR